MAAAKKGNTLKRHEGGGRKSVIKRSRSSILTPLFNHSLEDRFNREEWVLHVVQNLPLNSTQKTFATRKKKERSKPGKRS